MAVCICRSITPVPVKRVQTSPPRGCLTFFGFALLVPSDLGFQMKGLMIFICILVADITRGDIPDVIAGIIHEQVSVLQEVWKGFAI